MPTLKRTRKAANLGQHAVKKQKVGSDDKVATLSEVVAEPSRTSLLSLLSEDLDVQIHDHTGLEIWLAKSKRQLKRLFTLQGSSENSSNKRGPYKKKGTKQALRTEQHHKKRDRDWTEKMRKSGFRDLRTFFQPAPSPGPGTFLNSLPVPMHIIEDSDSEVEIGPVLEEERDVSERWDDDDGGDSNGNGMEEEEADDGMSFFSRRKWETHTPDEESFGELPECVRSPSDPVPEWTPSRPRPVPPPSPADVDKAINQLESLLRPKRGDGQRGYRDPGLDYTLRTRLEMMASFLRIYRMHGYENWIAASEQSAEVAGKKLGWMGRRLREWTHLFIRDPKNLPVHKYGQWNSSVLEDEDLKQEICLHLQSKGKYVCAMDIVHFLNTPDMKEQFNLKKSISERTAQRWMCKMGYRWKKEPKGQYKDGHERADVIAYRQNVFLPRMATLTPHMRKWDRSGNLETIAEESEGPNEPGPGPTNDGRQYRLGRWVVIWVHDESMFYANDRRTLRWVHIDETAKPYAKGEGASQMVADYVSPDYGWLKGRSNGDTARVLFKAGKNRDGYFTNSEILTQATRAMDILDKDFPDDIHWFFYDNAKTHTARRPNALSARHMLVKPPPDAARNFLCTVKHPDGTKTRVQMQDGYFPDGTRQSFYFPTSHPDSGLFKGMRNIIQERIDRGANLPNPEQLRAQCKDFKCAPPATNCCCRRILFNQPDFASQKSKLEELCESRGYNVIFYPKFHCELSFIEQCWGYAKRVYREFPASSLEADLERNVELALSSVPLDAMRRFSTRSLRFMDGYVKGMTGSQAAWAGRRYRGHRVYPETILEELEQAKIK